ncbi:unnamed protein product [Clonostachys chloroleuca]|uniref:Uncharacterized protein n=1 Tax=Clonostachys chloroleuca TaxID=1926264 RepID=A0AA35LYF9_9HYPO|nr:unnamed protein product [Clonostachys chloroleuca]
MSSLEDPEHIHVASEDSEQVARTVPDHLSLGPLLEHTLVERIPKGLSAFDSHDDVRMAFENFKRVVSPDDFSELTCATLDGSSTDSLTTQDPYFSVNDQIVLMDHPGLIESLAMIYADIFKFHTHVYEVVRGGNWKHRFFKAWGYRKLHIEGIINGLKAHRNTFDDGIWTIEGKHYEDLFLEGIDMCKQTEKASQYLDISDWLETNESEQSQVFNSIVSGASKPVFPHHWLLNHPTVNQ